jgi:ribonucleoside-diphosphate reductase alpha chain
MFKGNRRIGLGIMGLADMLFLLRLPYNSPEGRAAAAVAMRTIQEAAIDESKRISLEKGSFPTFAKSVWAGKVPAMRNASLTNVAPTGSTSMLVDGRREWSRTSHSRIGEETASLEKWRHS